MRSMSVRTSSLENEPSSVTISSMCSGGVMSKCLVVDSRRCVDRRELDHLARDDGPDAEPRRCLGQRKRSDLVADGAVPEDRVGADEQERRARECLLGVRIVDELDVEPGGAQILGERTALFERRGDGAEDALGGVCRTASRTVADAECVRTNASVSDGASWIAIAAAARSRPSMRPAHLLIDEAAQLLWREMRAVVRGREHAPDRTGDRAHRAPARRQLAARCVETFQQLL